jgi:glycosyltransferase involved in cell wall biosynthesis
MKIFAIREGGTGCDYFRVLLPMRELEKHGHDVTIKNAQLKRGQYIHTEDLHPYDVVIAQRLVQYGGLGSWRRARTFKNRLVYESDDNIFSVTPDNFTAFDFFQQKDVLEAVRAYAAVADQITVTNEALAGTYRQHNSAVTVIPNYLPAEAYRAPGERPACDRKVVGWVGGSSHGQDVQAAASAVQRFLKRNKDWGMYCGGQDFRLRWGTPLDRTVFEPWISIIDDTEGYYASLNFDIGLCPLMASEFNRCKTPVKAMEYMARGIPVIASDVEPYSSFIQHGVTGFLAKYEHDWIKYLGVLSDDTFRKQMAKQAFEFIQDYRMADHWQEWESAYDKMFS